MTKKYENPIDNNQPDATPKSKYSASRMSDLWNEPVDESDNYFGDHLIQAGQSLALLTEHGYQSFTRKE